MLSHFVNPLRKLASDQSGVTLVEYGAGLAVAILLAVGGVALLGGHVGTALDESSISMPE